MSWLGAGGKEEPQVIFLVDPGGFGRTPLLGLSCPQPACWAEPPCSSAERVAEQLPLIFVLSMMTRACPGAPWYRPSRQGNEAGLISDNSLTKTGEVRAEKRCEREGSSGGIWPKLTAKPWSSSACRVLWDFSGFRGCSEANWGERKALNHGS